MVVVLLLCTGLLLLDVLSRRARVIELSGQELKAKVDKWCTQGEIETRLISSSNTYKVFFSRSDCTALWLQR